MDVKNISELLKRVKIPISSKEIGSSVEEYLVSKGVRGVCKASSLQGGTLFLKTNSSVRQYIHTHKEELLLWLQNRFPAAHICDLK